MAQSKTKRKQYKFDAFICYASEDKKAFVEPLFQELSKYGLRIWFAPFSVKVGDSLRQVVDKGLTNSRFGIVIFSPTFFDKGFPQSELDGLFAREMSGERKIILPVWHQVDDEFVRKRSPTLVGRWAVRTNDGIPNNARQLIEVIKPKVLSLEVSRTEARRSNSRFLEQLETKNPAWAFNVSTGQIAALNPEIPGLVASVFEGNTRIDILPKDAKSYIANPLRGSLSVTGEGALKLQEFIRTGRRQEIIGKELVAFKTNLELPGLGAIDGTKGRLVLETGSNGRTIPVRVIFGSGLTAAHVAYMEARVERAGTEEFSLLTITPDLALSLRAIVSVGRTPTPQNVTINARLAGQEIHTAQSHFRAMLALQSSGNFAIRALQNDAVILKGTLSIEKPSEADIWHMNIIDKVVNVSNYLDLRTRWAEEIKKEDIELLAYLTAMIEKRPIGTEGHFVTTWTKSENSLAQFDSLKAGTQFALVQEEPLMFFGALIGGSAIARIGSACIDDFQSTRDRLQAAAIGDEIDLTYKITSPIYLTRWDKARQSPKDDPFHPRA